MDFHSIQCIYSFNSMHIFIQCNGYFQSIQWIFNSMRIEFNAYSVQSDIQFNLYSIQWIIYSFQCIFNLMHIQFNGYSIQWIFTSMHIQFNGYSIFNGSFNIQCFPGSEVRVPAEVTAILEVPGVSAEVSVQLRSGATARKKISPSCRSI